MSTNGESPAAQGRHICSPVYIAEGEVVCFDCGANYIYIATYDAQALDECREILKEEGRYA